MANRFQVGDLDVLVVSDGSVTFPAHAYFPASTQEAWAVHDRWRDHDGNLTFPYTCFLVRSGDRRVLIDTGVGDVTIGVFKGGTLLSELAENGVQPEDVDAVFLTHSHLDHVGTAALKSGGGVPAFPHASCTDGLLDIGVVRAETRVQWARVLGAAVAGRAERSPLVEATTGTRVEVVMERRLPWELDGGARSSTDHLKARVIPHGIGIRVP